MILLVLHFGFLSKSCTVCVIFKGIVVYSEKCKGLVLEKSVLRIGKGVGAYSDPLIDFEWS